MPQLSDPFSGTSLGAAWVDESTGGATTVVSGGQLALTGGGGNPGSVKTASYYDLGAAGPNGIQIAVVSDTGGNSYLGFFDNANHGYVFHVGGVLSTGAWTEPAYTSYTDDGNGVGFTEPILLRIAKNGTNIEFCYSTDGGSTWSSPMKSIAASGFNVGTVKVRLWIGASASCHIDSVVIDGGASPVLFEEDAFVPGVVPPGRQQVSWLATVFS
jgi:hypothetical protein